MPDLLDRLRSGLADRYRVEREIGRGGMAQVFLAHDQKLDRPVALKVLRPELAAALGGERFLQEIRLSAQLDHPHILPLLDSGDVDGTLFYTMPYVEGESLRERLDRESQLPLEEALQLTREIADALSHAHSRGIIHRDIKPENILLAGGHARVADFGIAKAVTEAGGENLTGTGVSIGTPAYMSPEQAEATKPVDGRSDLYSLGCVLYEMLAGHPPFAGSTAHELIVRHATDPVPPLRAARGTVPEPIEDAIGRALEKVPADRFPTAAQLRAALELDPVLYRRQHRRRRKIRRVASTLAAGSVAALGVWAVTHRPAPAPDRDSGAIAFDSTAIAVLPFQVVGGDSVSPARTLARFIGDLFELKVTGEFHYRIRHPGSVAERWRHAGGTLDSAMSEQAELAVARAVGAGRLVRGTVVALQDSLVVSASMLDVSTGRTIVSPVRVEGTLDEQQELVDQLITEILTRESGANPAGLPHLRRYKPEAVQAYLAGLRAPIFSPESKQYYRAALAADSTLVAAALLTYSQGEQPADTAELRYAWDHQEWLSERNRAYLHVLAGGRHSDIRTVAEVIEAYEAMARRWPEWELPRGELGGTLATWGAMADVPAWESRARAALTSLHPPGAYGWWMLTELAFLEGDTTRARIAADSLLATSGTSGMLAWRAPAYRWRLATLRGDPGTAARAFSELPRTAYGWVLASARADGRGIADAERVAAPNWRHWWWDRGREQRWRAAWPGGPRTPEIVSAAVPLYGALLLGVSEDRSVSTQLGHLERLAAGVGDPTPDRNVRALASCWLTLRRLWRGDTVGAAATVQAIDGDSVMRHGFAGWARLFDALVAQAAGTDVRGALLRMDSVVRDLPLPTGLNEWEPLPAEVQNLMLARLLPRYGEPERALAAARRRPYLAPFLGYYAALPEFLREEGRLAVIVGDTAGAIKAYSHYLALREDPDPPWRAQWDSVRVELDGLLRARG